MANTKITKLYPVIEETELVLETESGAFYAWKNDEVKKYNYKDRTKNYPSLDYKQYRDQVVFKGIKHPVLLQQGKGYWSTNTLFIQDFGKYIGAFMTWIPNLKVKEFIQKKTNNKINVAGGDGSYWHDRSEYRFYKDRSALIVCTHVFSNNVVIHYLKNPKYIEADNRRRYNQWELVDFTENYNIDNIKSVFNKKDSKGNPKFLNIDELSDAEIAKLSFHITSSNSHGITPSSFYAVDISKGYTTPIGLDNHNELTLSDSTIDMISRFYNDVDKEIWNVYESKYSTRSIKTMEDLINFVSCPTVERSKQILAKKQSNTEFVINMFKQYGVSTQTKGLRFARSGDDIIVTSHDWGGGYNYPQNVLLIHNVKKHTNRLFYQEENGKVVSMIPSFDKIMDYFDIVPYVGGGWGYRDDPAKTLVEYPEPVFTPSFEEVFADTNVMLFKSFKDIKFNPCCLSEHSINETVLENYKWNIQDIISPKIFSKFAWAVLFSDKSVAYEQMLKSDLFYLFIACLEEQSQIKDIDVPKNHYYHDEARMAIHTKARNLKKYFDLSMNQLKIIDTYIKNRYEKLTSEVKHRSRYYSSDIAPVLPPIYKMDEVFNTPIKNIDVDTFTNLITKLGNKKLSSYSWFSWEHFQTSYTGLQELKLSPSQYIDWLCRGYDFEKYSDYLRMRSKLKQIAETSHRPDLFNETAYPIYVKEPEDVKRLHDLVEKITWAYENKAKAECFDAAVSMAKKYEWSDKKDEKESLCIVAPNTITDLVEEGTALRHCVKSPMWVDAIANCESTILFIRKVAQKETPYFTVELSPDGKIRQCHGLSNCDPTVSIVEFLKRWTKATKNFVGIESVTSHYGALCAPRY